MAAGANGARSLGVVSGTAARASRAGLTWEAIGALDDEELERCVYGPPAVLAPDRPRPDQVQIHTELRRAHVTLELLHLEYLEQHPNGLRYTAFCDTYRHWLETKVTMRASCDLNDIEPWSYLRDLLYPLPDWPKNRVVELAPPYWKQTLQQDDAQQRLASNPLRRALLAFVR